MNEEQITILEGLLGIKHITVDGMLEDEGLQRADRDGSLVELGVVDEEVKYLKDVIQLPPLSDKDDESSDGDNLITDNVSSLSDDSD